MGITMTMSRSIILLAAAIVSLSGCASREAAKTSQEVWAQRYAEAYAKARTAEEVQKGFERLFPDFEALFRKSGVQSKGRAVVSLIVEPDGSASDIQIVASSFDAPLNSAIVELVSRAEFGARSVPVFHVPQYPVVYTPPSQ